MVFFIPMRQLLEISFSYLVMFGIVFRMFRLFSSSCHQLITTELHFTNKSWLEPTWLGYCCLREFEKIIISLPLEIDRHGPNWRQSHLFTAFLSSNSFFILGVLLLFEKRTHVQIFVPKTQHIWADINFHLNESQNALLSSKSLLQPLVIIIEVLPLQQWIMALQPVLREGTPQKVQSSPAPCLFQKRQSWWGHWLHPQHFSIRVLGT